MATEDIRVEYEPLSELRRWPDNPKRHNDAVIIASINRFGFNDPLVVDERSGKLIEGHGRLDALEEMRRAGQEPPGRVRARTDGEWLVPVARGVSFASDEEAEAYIAVHNQVTISGGWDDRKLGELLGRALKVKIPLVSLGFPQREIDRLLGAARPASSSTAPPAIAQASALQQKWGVARDQLWLIPSASHPGAVHTVHCGDCRNPEDVDRLADGARWTVAFTSPPYAAQRDYDPTSEFKPVLPEEYVAWFDYVQANVMAHLTTDGSWFINIKPHCESGQRHLYVTDLLIAHVRRWTWRFVDEFCWQRAGVPGAWLNRFKNGWEPVYHFSVNAEIKFHPQAVAHRTERAFGYGPANSKSKSVSGSGFLGNDRAAGFKDGFALPSNVVQVESGGAKVSGGHPAEFPVALPAWFIPAFSDAGDVVYDPFLGSGSTLLAAEATGRVGYGIEISPAYVAIALERAVAAGLEPRLA